MRGAHSIIGWFWVLLFLGIGLVSSSFAQTNFPVPISPGIWQAGILEQGAITESSGLVASRRYPGVFWTHNDSGNPHFLFAINQQGEHLGAFQVKGADPIDWEATALGDDGFLYFADTGTDGMVRSHSAVHRVEEPDPADRTGPAQVVETWYIRFPGAREDCESLFVFNDHAYLITKPRVNGKVRMYRFPFSDRSESVLLQLVTEFEVEADVSDASLSADKSRLGLVTEDGVEVIFINGSPAAARMAPRQFVRFENQTLEGGTFVEEGFLVTGEGTPNIYLFTNSRLSGAPGVTEALFDQSAFIGGSVTFRVEAFGFPAPTFEWRFNGALIPGQTGSTLTLTNLTLAQSGIYEVTISNVNGTVRSSARLTVRERAADLRVTEVMPSQAPGAAPTADWWELTSFDTEPVDLSGWRFNDGDGGIGDAFVLPQGLVIQPGESIVFVEDLTPDQFREWWGPATIPAGTQIITYSGSALSFSALGDSVRLWDNFTADDNAVAVQADFGPADVGISFTYDPNTGLFGTRSVVGLNGAVRAATGPDVGSPGRIRGEVVGVGPDVRITEVMSSEAVGSALTADWWELTSFEDEPVDLSGWRFNDNDGGLADAFVLPTGVSIQPGESIIFVEDLTPAQFMEWWGASNFDAGTQIITYTGTMLSFSSLGDSIRLWDDSTTDESALVATVTFGPADAGVSFSYDPTTGIFGGKSVAGVNGAFVATTGPDVGSPGRIRGEVVGGAPDLRITEVMSSEAVGAAPTADWWELTSFEDEPVDLSGWRFNDSDGTLADAFVFPAGLVIAPGESIIFVEDLTPAQFVTWWGVANIELGTQIVTYTGTSLSFSSLGDSVRVWDDEITDESALVASANFGPADPGVSFTYDPNTGLFGTRSVVGVNGAFSATTGPDVGSPGRIRGNEIPQGPDLRVTEVMSSEAIGPVLTADWWELTSFEDAPVDLSGWRFNDSDGGLADAFVIPQGVTISQGESIIFVEDLTPAQFLDWWGPGNIEPGTRIVTYVGTSLSFSSLGDSVRLWDNLAATDADLVTSAAFGPADLGVSFTYNPETGLFGSKSVVGVNGAFVAAGSTDIGSPGVITGEPPVDIIDLRVTEVMSSEVPATIPTADWWELTSFDNVTIDLSGWRFNDIDGGLSDAFVIPQGVTIEPGESIVLVEDLTPAEFVAWWGANTIPPGTQIITYTGTSLSFSSAGDSVRLWDNTTTNALELITVANFGPADPGVSFTYDPTTQTFGSKSQLGVNGAVRAAATSDIGSPGKITGGTVEDRPDVRITEVMSNEVLGPITTADWWELTSSDKEPIDLSGWRFNDNAGGLTDPFTLPSGLIIQPGESILFVEDLTPAEFRSWWGESNIAPTTRIITYSGTALSFSSLGDGLLLWDNEATNETDLVTRVDFGAAEPGISFTTDPDSGVFGELSELGVNGAFRAALTDDVGSPGRIRAPAGSLAIENGISAGTLRITVQAEAGSDYTLESRESLSESTWTETGETIQATTNGPIFFEIADDNPARFYRILED